LRLQTFLKGYCIHYQFEWSNGVLLEDIKNLQSGNYTVVVKDIKNCTLTKSFFVSQPIAPISLSINTTPAICFGESNGTAKVTISGGTPGYFISWDTGSHADSIFNLIAGTYNVTVRDSNLCSTSLSAQVDQPNLLLVNADSINVKCFGEATGGVGAIASGGVLPFAYLWSNNINTPNVSNLSAGIYFLQITDGINTNTKKFIIE
jgi:hypothetical protein